MSDPGLGPGLTKSELSEVHVASSSCILNLVLRFGPDPVEVSRSVGDSLAVIAVGKIKSGGGRIILVGRCLDHAFLAAPIGGAVDAAGHIDIPVAAGASGAPACADIVAATGSPVIHPDHLYCLRQVVFLGGATSPFHSSTLTKQYFLRKVPLV